MSDSLLARLLSELQLDHHRSLLEEEELTFSLLASMRADLLVDSLAELGFTPAEALRLQEGLGGGGSEVAADEGGADAAGGWSALHSLPPSSDASARRERFSVRLPAGGVVQAAWQGGRPPVWAVLGWLAAVLKLDVDELIGKYALVDRSSLPPRELEDEAATLRAAGLAAGATLLLQPRAGEMETVGRLCGSYTFADEAFRKAGMLVLLHGPSASSRALAHDLQARLHFLSLAFVPASVRRLAAAAGSGEGEDDAGDAGYSAFGGDSLEAGAEELHIVMRFLQAQQPALRAATLGRREARVEALNDWLEGARRLNEQAASEEDGDNLGGDKQADDDDLAFYF
ncbi:hypothetical protein EMIHUDRAFT_448790 [Emiliania huxleyi CCMP1516]|uniref:UBX domain-containing protein n=2 Tax=Emiliania huxleyi TaxID=2903 RepID=A0A0D3L078_EMIH1|nr:hypothetical protein EMIHUDRAFT_448790 [Emiliania huxleyi CCMP1516]EOD41413.1 hypothetical protein EMIHUDRAFT_448790 [Emiliania huxleyi CCMP1516]|eukprot:XP_005793842.1 hypothetical protein EMIHUDRAFT_448790 [Emiliania huxleyi CCMP1516]